MPLNTQDKFALCLRGESHLFKKTFQNIKLNIIDALNIQDVYLSTYRHDDFQNMLSVYMPNVVVTPINENNSYVMVIKHTLGCLKNIKKSGIYYDYIIITRFDAVFEYDFKRLFEEKRISPNDFSVLCRCELAVEHVDDMLWIISGKLLDILIEVLEIMLLKGIWTHSINQQMNEKVGYPVTRPLFDGKYYLLKNRPFIKLAREL